MGHSAGRCLRVLPVAAGSRSCGSYQRGLSWRVVESVTGKVNINLSISRQTLGLERVALGTQPRHTLCCCLQGSGQCQTAVFTVDLADFLVQMRGCGRFYSQDISQNKSKGMFQ